MNTKGMDPVTMIWIQKNVIGMAVTVAALKLIKHIAKIVNALILHSQQLQNLQLPANILHMLETSFAMMKGITKNAIGMEETVVEMKLKKHIVLIVNA